jgi:hypothetical protein
MLAQKRREVELFSLSFMDCICCGFGAILLIFILTTGQKSSFDRKELTELKERVGQLTKETRVEKEEIERLAKSLAALDLDLKGLRDEKSQEESRLTEREKQMQLLLREMSTLQDVLAKLMEQKAALPMQVEAPPLPLPNVDRRQYLTGVRLEGDYILFLVRASGSMLGETIDEAASRLGDADFKKRDAPKWQRVVRGLEWMLANLGPNTRFQIQFFNDEVTPILPARPDDWFNPRDKPTMSQVLTRLHEIVPGGSANMERAFNNVRLMQRLPASIVLFTDSLPTASDTLVNGGVVDDETRIRFFHAARKQLPARIPVSTILFPLNGDPAGPALYWELANATRGALVSPSKSWPDT